MHLNINTDFNFEVDTTDYDLAINKLDIREFPEDISKLSL
jgi:hypothetical protein